jgi:hypothetical protein
MSQAKRRVMSDHTFRALGGFVFLLPAVTLVLSGLLGLNPPAAIVHPLVLILGLAAALLLNLASTVSTKAKRKEGIFLGGVAIQFHKRLLNLAVLTTGTLLLSTIALYLFVENFAPR